MDDQFKTFNIKNSSEINFALPVLLVTKKESIFKKSLLLEKEVLEKSGYKVTVKLYTSIRELLGYLFSLNGYYYHSHDLSAMFWGFIMGVFGKFNFIKNYHQLLLPPLYPAKDEGKGKEDYYEQQGLWDKDITERDLNRIESTISLIPPDVNTVLDVGCGSGFITNRLKSKFLIMGLDISFQALTKVDSLRIQAASQYLPFKEKAFDLVICTEVIEHLQKEVYLKTINEIKRVAKKYILVGLPFDEELTFSNCFCYNCKRRFHINFHERSFKENKLKRLFTPQFKFLKRINCGLERVYYNNLLLFVKQRIAGVWLRKETTICLYCGASQKYKGVTEKNFISWYCDKQNLQLRQRLKNKALKSHMALLYERKA
jgi:ubiquinone/menaquinone biosynthesis C-methylase UbiE